MDYEQARLEIEREKWQAEVRSREQELAFEKQEQSRSRWINPLVVAILAAALAAVGNAFVTFINGSQQLVLEESKAESARVLAMIQTGDSDKAADNLHFLLKAGLINEKGLVERIRVFLDQRRPGTGPSLPVPGSPFRFEQTSGLTRAVQTRLESVLTRYIGYLSAIGFTGFPEGVRIKIDDLDHPNAFYLAGQNIMVIDARIADDNDAALKAYTHHVLLTTQHSEAAGSAARTPRAELQTIESGLGDRGNA